MKSSERSGVRTMHRLNAFVLIPVLGIAGAAVITTQTASAATYTVDRIDFDEGDAAPGDGVCAMSPANGGGCTLRAAMMEANLTPEADVINLPASTVESPIYVRRLRNPQGPGFPFQEFDELEGDIEISGSVTIRGINPSDPAATIISGRGRGEGFDPAIFDRIFQISPKFGPVAAPLDVIIEGVTLANGRTEVENWGGGAILVFSQSTFGPNPISPPKLTLRNVVFRNNYSAISGGALSNYGGTVDIDNVIFEGNANSYTPNFTGAQNTQQPVLFLSGGQGGTIANWAGDLTMRNSVISGSYSQAGGAIYAQDASNIPTLTVIENSVIRGNFGFMGAAIFNMSRGTWDFGSATLVQHGMVLNRVTIETNEAEFAGGAIYNIGTILLSNCVVSSNRAWDAPGNPTYPNKGGGIYNSGRVLDIQSSTIAGNDAEEPRLIAASSDDTRGGDEIYLDHTNNIDQRGFRVAFTNAIVGDNLIGLPVNDPGAGITDDCAGPIGYGNYLSSQGGNLYRDNTCAPAPAAAGAAALATGDKVGLDPMIEPLAANNAIPIVRGEVVKTMALKPGSPAIGNGIAALCPGSDARNFERIGACDSGAFQQNVNASASGNRAPAALADSASTNAGTAVTIKVLANDSDPDAVNRVKQLALAADAIRQPTNGAVVVASNSSVVYTPVAGFTGTDQFRYLVTDGAAQSEGNVTVSVYDPATANTPPKGVPDVQEINLPDPAVSGSSAPVATVSIDVLANDSDADAGDTLRIERVRGPTTPVNGVELITPQQQGPGAAVWSGVDVRVNGGVSGIANFEYDLIDNRGGVTNNVGVTLRINTIPAVLQSDIPKPVEVTAGQAVSGSIKATDRDGQPLRFTLLQAPASLIGTATVNEATGAYTFTASTLNGDGSFLVGVSDGSPPVSVPVGIKVIGGTDPVPTPGTGTTAPGTGTGTPPGQNNNNPGGGTASPPVPASSSNDDGGGSIDPFWFGLLAGAGILSRYRRHGRARGRGHIS